MTDAELFSLWRVWLAVGGGVVLVAAALLITIWRTARAIEREVARALEAAGVIADQTGSIWELEATNREGDQLLGTVREIEAKAEALAEALHRPAGAAPTS